MGVVWELVGWLGTGLIVLSMAQQRITRLRLINLVGSAILVGYNLWLGVWPMVALNVALTLIQLYHLNILLRTRHDETVYAVAAAAPEDAVVAHLLARHGAEIRSFHPAFREPADSSVAFLVMTGDELVGLVLATVDGEGTAHLDVDYVTPAYRDFTPAEFVFRRSGVWHGLGVTRIRTRAGGPGHYADLGFDRRDGVWELAVPTS